MGISIDEICNKIVLTDEQKAVAEKTLKSLDENGNGALSMFTSGGKSFIAAVIAYKYIVDTQGIVLWLGPKSANDNVYASVISGLESKIKTKIIMISYENISRNKIRSDIAFQDIVLVIMDESHKALAQQRYPNLLKLLDKCNCDKLAMSATQQRTDGRDSFAKLVPQAEYTDYGLDWAADKNIINDINYYVCITKISKFDFSSLNKFAEIAQSYSDIQSKYNRLQALLRSYKFNFKEDFYTVLHDSTMSVDGSTGDRHIVFFSTIDELKGHKDDVEDVFKKLYPKCKVTVYEYHSHQSQSENNRILNQAVNSIPKPNTVDIILTVNKGNESIHPRHIKSVSMFRHTASHIVFTQQIGRGITLKSHCDNPTYIFDFSEGFVSLLKGTSIEYGRRTVDERVENFKDIRSLESLTEELKHALSHNVKVVSQFATQELRELSRRLNKFRNESFNNDRVNMLYEIVLEITKEYKEEWKKSPDIRTLENLLAKLIKDKGFKPRGEINQDGSLNQELLQWFNYTHGALLTKRIDEESQLYKRIRMMGHLFYHGIDGASEKEEELMSNIDVIKNCMKRAKVDVNQLGKNSIGTKYINRLRVLSMQNQLPVNVTKYARDNDISLTVDTLEVEDIIRIAPKEEKNTLDEYIKEIKLAEQLSSLLQDPNHSVKDAYSIWIKLNARHYINKARYASQFAKYIRHKIAKKYDNELKYKTLRSKDIEDGNLVISALIKYKEGQIISGLHQDYLFKNYDLRNVSDYIREIFREFGIRRGQTFEDLISQTAWMKDFEAAVAGDVSAMAKIQAISPSNMDEFRQKRLRTRKFTCTKKQIKENVDTQLLIGKAKSMIEANDEAQSKIGEALKNNQIDSIDIITAPFFEKDKEIVKEIMQFNGTVTDYINSNQRDWNRLYIACKASASCAHMIIPNILNIKNLDKEMVAKLSDIQQRITR